MKKFTFNTFLNILLVLMVLAFIARYFYMKPKFITGEDVPDFTAVILGGEEMKLSDLRGNYVLLDFWGSWCGPCRAENPRLVQLFDKYSQASFEDAEGVEIVSVAIERNLDRWKRAIQSDGLKWKYHIADIGTSLKFFNSPIASQFGVKQVPSKYLLNKDGVIIRVNPSIEELDEFLAKKMN